MRPLIDPHLEMKLHHLERMLARPGRAKGEVVGEARHLLQVLHHELLRSSREAMSPEMHEALHMLLRRSESAASPEEVRDLLRDTRQYIFAFSSFSRAHAVEDRLHELENQMQAVAQGAAATGGGPTDEEAVVTLDNLKQKRVLFTIMPFHPDFEDIWTGGIQRAAAGTGLTPVRIDMITKSSEITDEIVEAIRLAEIVVVDVTRNNPNVMFEFGFALALKKAHAVISQSTEFLTFDIKNVRTVIYQNSWRGIESLHKELQKFIKGALGRTAKEKKPAGKRAAGKKGGA